jgi:F0F1-type ATP synthase assembly protein I
MIEPGRGLAYLALFSEIGLSLLVTTLLGVLIGYWADQQLGIVPILTVVGFFAGAGIGTVAIYKLVSRFLEKLE